MTDKYPKLDVLRAYSAIGIFLMHVLANTHYELPMILKTIISPLGALVRLFMLAFTFSCCCDYYHRFIENKISIGDFYIGRVKKELPFFAFLSLVDVAVEQSISKLPEVFANLTLLFGFMSTRGMCMIGVAWFLGVVFVLYLLFPFFCWLLQKKIGAWTAFWISGAYNILCKNGIIGEVGIVN